MLLQIAAVLAVVIVAAVVIGLAIVPIRVGWPARLPWAAAGLIVVVSAGINLVHAAAHGLPHPKIHDEFCYLLNADTFAHGRLTNPTPPVADHFEAPNLLLRPTYQCKYPPAQGLTLAVGEVVAGRPIVGTWAAAALASAAVFWGLLAFVPAPWATLGGLAAAVQPQFLHWSQDYWGGTVAMLGGALVLGGWARLMVRFGVGPAVAVGVGLAILANSRPYEGLSLSTPLMLALAVRAVRTRQAAAAVFRCVLPLAVILVPTFAWMAYYDYRVTGHATRFPYAEFSNQYGIYPKLWPAAKLSGAPAYHTLVMRQTYTEDERNDYDRFHTPKGLVRGTIERAAKLLLIAADPYVLLLAVPFAWPVVRRGIRRAAPTDEVDRRLPWILIAVATLFGGLWLETVFITHYAAPGVAAELTLVVVGWRAMAGWAPRGIPVGRGLAAGLAVACGVAGGIALVHPVQLWTRDPVRDEVVAASPQLRAGRHLVYLTDNQDFTLTEWGYNTADPAAQRIVWAHTLPTGDADLARAFPGRQTWRMTLRPHGDVRLEPYQPAATRP